MSFVSPNSSVATPLLTSREITTPSPFPNSNSYYLVDLSGEEYSHTSSTSQPPPITSSSKQPISRKVKGKN
jgi:hypothetical protein